MQIIKIFYSKT